jgi:hypothetical protein
MVLEGFLPSRMVPTLEASPVPCSFIAPLTLLGIACPCGPVPRSIVTCC